jgi:hypothetical protein
VSFLNGVLSLAVYRGIVVPMHQTPEEAPASARLVAAVWTITLVLTVAKGGAAQVTLVGGV